MNLEQLADWHDIHWLTLLAFCSLIFLSVISWLGYLLHKSVKQVQSVLEEKQEYEMIFGNDFVFIWQIDLKTAQLSVSSGASQLIGYDLKNEQTSREFWSETVYPEDRVIAQELFTSLRSGEENYAELRFLDPTGKLVWVGVYGYPVFDESDQIEKLVGLAINISEPKRMHTEMHRNAFFDRLTGLPNHQNLEETFYENTGCSGKSYTFYSLDIDRFKVINQNRGREVGDLLLVAVASRLTKTLGKSFFVARESGDEFLLLKEEFDYDLSPAEVAEVAEELLNLFKQPFMIDQRPFYVTCSIGVTRYPKTARTFEELIYQAESAMYVAKENGKNGYHVFENEDEVRLERKHKIELCLKEAIQKEELSLVYQPKINLETGQMDCAETLVRWQSPELGFVSPGEFIPIAEEAGIITDMGQWIMERAITQAKQWREQGAMIDIAINVSPLQFEEPDFIDTLCKVLEEKEFNRNHVIIEITETMMKNTDLSIEVTRKLHELGLRIAIDDFGTGYSSLSALNQLTVDYVKIDKSFIDPLPHDQKASALVKQMLQMGENLGFKIVAEGIETKEQAEFLKEHHCTYGQGYLFSKPVDPETILSIA